jgi:hypothetical protein
MPIRRSALLLLIGGLTLGFLSCSDEPASNGPAGPEPVLSEAPGPKPCDTGAVSRSARSYFSQPESKAAQELLGALAKACAAGDDGSVRTQGWQVIALVEQALEAARGGDPTTGDALLNGLIDCLENRCLPTSANDLAFAASLGTYGLFAVRSGGTAPAVQRAALPFTDFSGAGNQAIWGLEVDQAWSYVTGSDSVLLFGAPVSGAGISLLDLGFGGLQFDMNRYPVPPPGAPGNPFRDEGLHVGVCFASPVELPHPDGDEGRRAMDPRMQREAVLLEFSTPSFCGEAFPTVQSASLLGAAIDLARGLLPRPLLAAFFSDRQAPSLGGTPLNFSHFAPVAAQVEGSLEWVTPPPGVVVEGEPLGPLEVRALSGAGTPIEKVLVALSIRANQGVPAGAVLSGDTSAVTDEERGIATFPDGGADAPSIGKPGGYLVCANATLTGYEFPEACVEVHARNAN